MTVYEFIANQPDTEKVIVCAEYETFRMSIADLKEAEENKHYIVDSWYWEKDPETWFFAIDANDPGMPEEIDGEYLMLWIHDGKEE